MSSPRRSSWPTPGESGGSPEKESKERERSHVHQNPPRVCSDHHRPRPRRPVGHGPAAVPGQARPEARSAGPSGRGGQGFRHEPLHRPYHEGRGIRRHGTLGPGLGGRRENPLFPLEKVGRQTGRTVLRVRGQPSPAAGETRRDDQAASAPGLDGRRNVQDVRRLRRNGRRDEIRQDQEAGRVHPERGCLSPRSRHRQGPAAHGHGRTQDGRRVHLRPEEDLLHDGRQPLRPLLRGRRRPSADRLHQESASSRQKARRDRQVVLRPAKRADQGTAGWVSVPGEWGYGAA